jgi:MFS family permease
MGAIALAAGWRVMPGPYGEPSGRFDATGTLVLTAITVASLFAVDSLDLTSLAWVAVAAVALVFYVRHARRATTPIVKLEHIVPQPYRGLAVSTALLLTGTFAMSTYIPLYVRAGLEGSPALTAWSVLPLTVGWTVGALISSRMADRQSESWIVLLGFLVGVPSLAAAGAAVYFGVPLFTTFVAFFTAGVGVGMATNAALTLLRSVTDSARIGRVISAHLFSRNQGFTFGSAIGGAVLLFIVTLQLGDVELVRELIASPEGGGPTGAAEAVQVGFAATIAVGLVLAMLGSLSAIRMRRYLTEARAARGAAGGSPRRR